MQYARARVHFIDTFHPRLKMIHQRIRIVYHGGNPVASTYDSKSVCRVLAERDLLKTATLHGRYALSGKVPRLVNVLVYSIVYIVLLELPPLPAPGEHFLVEGVENF